MVDATHKSFKASDRSYYSILKKEIHNLARSMGFEDKRIAEIDIIIAEITSNLYKYANGGELLVGAFNTEHPYIEIICMDEGPGMSELNRMLSDGYSSTNTMGHGLGSIKRLSDQFDIFSLKGWGTILLSRVYKAVPPKAFLKRAFQVRPIVVAKPGESSSGDGHYVKTAGNHIKIMLGDGLGHGPEANYAVNEAVKVFKQCPEHSPVEIIRYLHAAVRKTRGLVGTIAVIDTEAKQMMIAGVGNIAAKLTGPLLTKSPLSYNGIIGHNIPNTMNDQLVNLGDYHQLALCSDGIRSRWEINKYPGLLRVDMSIQAAAVYKEFARLTDDMSVIIAKL